MLNVHCDCIDNGDDNSNDEKLIFAHVVSVLLEFFLFLIVSIYLLNSSFFFYVQIRFFVMAIEQLLIHIQMIHIKINRIGQKVLDN